MEIAQQAYIPSYKRNSTIIETDLGMELVLLNPETRQMYSLNNTGRYIWKYLPELGLSATLNKLTQTFAVGENQACRDIYDLTQQLTQNGLFQELKEDLSFDILGCHFRAKGLVHSVQEWLLDNWSFSEHYHHPLPLEINLSVISTSPSNFPIHTQPQPLSLTDRQVPFIGGNPSFFGTQQTGLKMEITDNQVNLEVWGSSNDLLPLLHLALVESLRKAEYIPLHAAVIAKEGEATALLAASGVGKTTTFIQSVRSGWQPVCEDFAWLDPRSMKIYGWDNSIRLLPDSHAHFKSILKLENASQDAHGKYVISYSLLGWKRPETPTLKRLVFLERDSVPGWQDISSKDAVLKLWDATGLSCFGAHVSTISNHIPHILRSTRFVRLGLEPLVTP
jgi:hypothetical protein